MEKRILLIGNNAGLPGVAVDIKNYRQFFKSAWGGNWNENEMIEKMNVSKSDLLEELSRLKSLSLNYLIVIFTGHGGYKRETMLELNSRNEYVNESELTNLSYRQLNIYDCCRCVSEQINENIRNQFKEKFYTVTSTRERFENRIRAANHQQVSLYACSVGEVAHDTSNGAIYSSNLIKCAKPINDEFKLVGAAHMEAATLTTIERKDQHPDSDIPRYPTTEQLIIGIRP